jgi:hypothetical protein
MPRAFVEAAEVDAKISMTNVDPGGKELIDLKAEAFFPE